MNQSLSEVIINQRNSLITVDSQLKTVLMQNQCNSLITFDPQLKTALIPHYFVIYMMCSSPIPICLIVNRCLSGVRHGPSVNGDLHKHVHDLLITLFLETITKQEKGRLLSKVLFHL